MLGLLGLETEYAFTVFDATGHYVDRDEALNKLFGLARASLPHLRDVDGPGMYLGNGSRLYVDYGSHPELSTPECDDPVDVVRHALAGERILARLAAELPGCLPVHRASFFRCNVDYSGTGQTWGCHESYLCRNTPERVGTELLPHLVSRIIYTGAGGFDSLSGGLTFTLSPRVPHLRHVRSRHSTESRGILHGKDEPLCAGEFHRLHLICGESLCSERASLLKLGTTALLVHLIDAGRNPCRGLRLARPLLAMRSIARDPSCRRTVAQADGQAVSALDLQRTLLERVELHLGEGCLPPFAEPVCKEWRDVLDCLEEGPEATRTQLDWSMKLALFQERARRRGVAWQEFAELQKQAARLERSRPRPSQGESDSIGSPPRPDPAQLDLGFQLPAGASEELQNFTSLRSELYEVDTRFGELGDRGIFASLDRSGVLSHRIPGRQSIEDAVSNPPSRGRAHERGSWIQLLSPERGRYQCDWQGIFDTQEPRRLDLSDPFGREVRWRTHSRAGELSSRRASRLQERLRGLLSGTD